MSIHVIRRGICSRPTAGVALDLTPAKLWVAAVMAAFVLLETALGRFAQRERTTRKDVIIDLGSATLVPLVIIPTVLSASAALVNAIAPGRALQTREGAAAVEADVIDGCHAVAVPRRRDAVGVGVAHAGLTLGIVSATWKSRRGSAAQIGQ